MIEGIDSFSLRQNLKLKLQEIHMVNDTSETTQIIIDTRQSLCSISPTDEKYEIQTVDIAKGENPRVRFFRL